MSDENRTVHLPVSSNDDVVQARREGRRLAARAGLGPADRTALVAALTEVLDNVVRHAGTGEVRLRVIRADDRPGLEIEVTDRGGGIPDVERALEEGYSTGEREGLGLPGARCLADELEVHSELGEGTRVRLRLRTTTG